jgi:hypothetical protein
MFSKYGLWIGIFGFMVKADTMRSLIVTKVAIAPVGTCSRLQGDPTRVNGGVNRAHALDGKSSVNLASHGYCTRVFIGT